MKSRHSSLALLVPVVFLAACLTEDARREELGTASSALTSDQCSYFANGGKTSICHKTNSLKNPYTVLSVDGAACSSHAEQHAGDYVAGGDTSCSGGGCLPQGAPCDATLPCCSGSTCESGTCVQTCTPSTCKSAGATCGVISDGCGDELECGGPCACTLGTLPPKDVSAGLCACHGGAMSESWCKTFGWTWTGSACVVPKADAKTCAELQDKHRGDASGSTIYNLGVCCGVQGAPPPPPPPVCTTPPTSVTSGSCACYGGHMNESWCASLFGASFTWTGDACVPISSQDPASLCAALQAKHQGDGSGKDGYNLGLCCGVAN